MQDDGVNLKNIIEEKKPEWKAVAEPLAVASFFTNYASKMKKRRAKKKRDRQKSKAFKLAKRLKSGKVGNIE